MEKRIETSRWWFLTINNPTDTLEDYHTLTKAGFTIGQKEKGESGTVHMQFVLWFKEPIRFARLKKLLPEAHIEPVKDKKASLEYVVKTDTRIAGPWQFGIKPVVHNDKNDWQQVWELAKRGSLDQIPADIRVQHYTNLKRIEKDHIQTSFQTAAPRGVWISGSPGTGKTHLIRAHFGESLYLKNCNKWWDGYQEQMYVVLEDVDHSHWQYLINNMKIWADKYAFLAESKGGAVSPKYRKLFVTSNYTIDELMEKLENIDDHLIRAVKRRFQVFELRHRNEERVLYNCNFGITSDVMYDTIDQWVLKMKLE